MNNKPKIHKYKNQKSLVNRIRDDFKSGDNDFILLYAYNGTGKTRLSMEFKEKGKKRKDLKTEQKRDTLYFNAFTEDLFYWDNDLDGDSFRVLHFRESHFFDGLEELEMESRIREYLHRYADFDFTIDYENKRVTFRRDNDEAFKVSRGEENIFIWCFFLSVARLAIDAKELHEPYSWVEFLYIDDPISSLDDNNAIAVASDLAHLLKEGREKIKAVISSHHGLFFNVMSNELKTQTHKKYFLHYNVDNGYTLRNTDDTPFFHHISMLDALQKASQSGELYAYHFNMLRNVLEKTSTFFGYKDFSDCLHGIEDENLYARALNLLSHGKYSIYEPKEMVTDNKDLFKKILDAFLSKYEFDLPEIH
ncbi:MAG: AAA family ATPase [Epsilonproteobacteria bacterium]|nr:AAA family ATPase [Campylobacterota bacterium]